MAYKMKTSLGSKLFDIVNYSFMILFCFTVLLPIWDMIVVSFSPASEVSYLRTNLWPKEWTLDAYEYCLNSSKIYNAFFVSVCRTILGMAYHLLLCSMAAYALTRSQMPLRKTITFLFLVPMFFTGGLIPVYMNIKMLGLLDNFWVYVLPCGFSIYNTIIIRNYFYSIDSAMEEAASIDGASRFRIFFSIILPLSKPVLATVALWQMVAHWNTWFDNLIYVRKDSLLTLQMLLRKMTVETELLASDARSYAMMNKQVAMDFNSDTIKAATTILVILPIVMVYPFLQKYFVKGIMVGAVKG
ncbi:MAG: carbohydrate ABC transporter permease [Oscillospiraceae bacterium]